MERSLRYFRNHCDFHIPIDEFEDVILTYPSSNIQSSDQKFMVAATEKAKTYLSQKIIANCWFRKQSPPPEGNVKTEEKNKPSETDKEPKEKDPQEEGILFVPDSAILVYECMQRRKLKQKEANKKKKKDEKDKDNKEDEEEEDKDEDEWEVGKYNQKDLPGLPLFFDSPKSVGLLYKVMQKLGLIEEKKDKGGKEDEMEMEKDDEEVETEEEVRESDKKDQQKQGSRIRLYSAEIFQKWKQLCKQLEEEINKYKKEDKKGKEDEKTKNEKEGEVKKDAENVEKEEEKEEGEEKEKTMKEPEEVNKEKRQKLKEIHEKAKREFEEADKKVRWIFWFYDYFRG